MTQEKNQAIKLLLLMDLLRSETDEEHPMPLSNLCERLQNMGVVCDTRTLSRNIRMMERHGYEIMKVKGYHTENAFYVSDRSFSEPELKILADAVQAASFVTEKKTNELVNKIAHLGGQHHAALMQSNLVRFNTRKHSNEAIYYAVGYLEEAIAKNRKIAFRYFDLDENKNRVYRGEDHVYTMEPIALIFNEDNYYLVTYNEKYKGKTNYRVDRMDHVEVLEEPISEKAKKLRQEMSEYTASSFKMYSGDNVDTVLRFDEKMIGAVLDKFGESTRLKRVGEHLIEAKVNVQIAPTFWGWLFQFGLGMEIISPDSVRQECREKIKELYQKYGQETEEK